ncbi:exportin-6-like isoform X1 [Glossina fuscipes]|uniref:Exportin-6-like isoform X1 n=1 Tax=Glossina fuscipes TaxID=7396 RepID=A0A9C5ZF15_9MUSC|nr:exportin-6-like isoform X1 [Glossina fuscipes]XP_037899256.1 exportin-6-like isoform X1 [Glossina fuscipes]
MSSPFAVVESLLHEFYTPTTPNARKREIEVELLAFKNQSESWKTCLSAVSNATTFEQNHFLWFFATSTLDHTITRRWMQLGSSDRALLRETLWHTYANLACASAKRQRDTYAQLIALLGKRQFPDEDPNYLAHCIALTKTNFSLGICLLRTTSEEVVSSREDVSTDRKQYFHSCVSICLPEVTDLLTKYLLIAVCHINGKDIHSIPSTLMDYNLITSLPNDNQLSNSILEFLSCVQHLVSWMNTDLLSEYFFMSILDLSQWRSNRQDISLNGLSVLNELLYLQKPLPFSNILMSGVNGLLDQYHSSNKQHDEMYTDKFRELLRLYAIKYWPRMLDDLEVLEAFLNSLYCWTIHRNGAYDFTEKLEIWTPIIKGISAHNKLNRFYEIVQLLVPEIMRRTQFEYNKTELELLDNELMEDNTQTEWQQYITQCIECIALIAEPRSSEVFALVFSHWGRPYMYLRSLENDVDCGKTFDFLRKMKSQSLPENLRDFTTICQAVVRIIPLLENNNSELGNEINYHLNEFAENLWTVLKFLISNKLTVFDVDKSIFQTDFDYLYAQVLMAIRSILPLSNILKADQKLVTIFEALTNIFQTNNLLRGCTIIQMAASQLLLCISSVIRPKSLLEFPAIINIMQSGPRLSHLPSQVQANIYISIVSYLILPWKNVDERGQDYEHRSIMLREYVDSLARSFLQLDLNTINSAIIAESKISSMSLNLLTTFSLVIEYFKSSPNTSKDLLSTAFKPIITKALMIYNTFGQSSNIIATTVADFSLSVLHTLQTQLGTQFIKEMINLFITVNSRDQLSISTAAVIEKILQMFQLIVKHPGSASLTMIPSILDFTFAYIIPLLQQDDNIKYSGDITSAVYDLFDSILNYKWQYFYKFYVQPNGISSFQNAMNGSNGAITSTTENLHPEHFMAIMNAYGQILISGNDPNIVRIVLNSLQSVHDRWRLYQRPLFKDNLLASFQSALISVLLTGEGALHFDLLANTLFNMSQVDNIKMRESFAQAGLPINMKLIDEICLTKDIPTFSQKLTQLIQDAHCVHLTQN